MKRIVSAMLIVGALCLSGPAHADVSADNAKEAVAAFQAFEALQHETQAAGALPRLSDPDQAAVLNRLWNRPATLGESPYQIRDLPALRDIAAQAAGVLKIYQTFQPQSGGVVELTADPLAYQDEIARATAYLVTVDGAALQALTTILNPLAFPPRITQLNEADRAALRQMRSDIIAHLGGALDLLQAPALRRENRLLLLTALADNAVMLGTALPSKQLVKVTTAMLHLPADLTGVEKDKAQEFRKGVMQFLCIGLCQALGN